MAGCIGINNGKSVSTGQYGSTDPSQRMSNFCSLQFSICFLQNLQGALQLTPMNNIVPQVVIELTYFWFRWEYSDDIPLTYKAGHDISRTLWQRRLLTLTFFLLPPSFVAHKYGDSANARRDQGRERVMVRLRLNILHAKYDHRQWREEGERAATLLSTILYSTLAKWHRFPRQ